MFQIIDDLVPKGFADALENMCKTEIPWQIESTISGFKGEQSKNLKVEGANFDGMQFGFYHWAMNGQYQSPFFDRILPLMYFLEQKTGEPIKEIHRIRLALTTSVGKEVQHFPHVDAYYPHKVLLYYVNDSDGDTFMMNEMYDEEQLGADGFTDIKRLELDESTDKTGKKALTDFTVKQRVTPQKGRAIVFDGYNYHNSSKPVNHEARYIVNIDFI